MAHPLELKAAAAALSALWRASPQLAGESGERRREGSGQRDAFLELNNASVVLGGTRVLDGLTLTIRVGEHAAILGPNGAGKSTLMKLLTLQQYPAVEHDGQAAAEREGSSRAAAPIRVFGRERWDVFELRSQLGMVSADLHDRFIHGNSNGVITGLDAVVSGFFASQGVFAHQRVTAGMRAQAMDALERVDAAQLAGATLDTMSTGEARRVLIARALVHQPKALVLDEPTRGLDLVARHAFMERVRQVARQGTTILLVTHHVEEIIPEIARVILLQRGRVAWDGLKPAVLTAERLGQVFDARLVVEQSDGYYHVRVM
jgi:iron complex transport system ATP-binding protein